MTLTPQITTLIDKFDTSEIVRDQIAAILLVESKRQQEIATEAGKEPKDWKLRVFTERTNPFSEWIAAPDPLTCDATPLVNVWFDRAQYDRAASDPVERQRAEATYNIDCYGYGVSQSDGASGHIPGDTAAALEAQRALRLVRNILIAGAYTYLGLRGVVGHRWPTAVEVRPVEIDARPVQHVHAARIALRVDFNEFSPQVQGVPLQYVSVEFTRADNGELLLKTDFDLTAPPP